MKFQTLFSILAVFFIAGPSHYLLAETIGGSGYNRSFYQTFFQKIQPKEYYDFPQDEENYSGISISQPVLDYINLEDFSTPNTWSINSPSDKFTNVTSNKEQATDQDLLKWRTIDNNSVESGLLPPINVSKTIRAPLPNMLGIRSLFLSSGLKKIFVFPKEPINIESDNPASVEVWAFGMNLKYDMFAIFEDKDHNLHQIRMGDMNYFGWKRLKGKLNIDEIGGIHPSLQYTTAIDTKIKLKALLFQSQYATKNQTEGFFGVWISDLGMTAKKSKIPATFPTKLTKEFDWDNTNTAPAN